MTCVPGRQEAENHLAPTPSSRQAASRPAVVAGKGPLGLRVLHAADDTVRPQHDHG
jgi:hypothetical protein